MIEVCDQCVCFTVNERLRETEIALTMRVDASNPTRWSCELKRDTKTLAGDRSTFIFAADLPPASISVWAWFFCNLTKLFNRWVTNLPLVTRIIMGLIPVFPWRVYCNIGLFGLWGISFFI